GAGAGGAWLHRVDVPVRPPLDERTGRVLGGAAARPGAGIHEHGASAVARRRAGAVGDAGPVRGVRGAARRTAALGMVALVRNGVRPGRADERAGRAGLAGAAAGAAPLADGPAVAVALARRGAIPRRRVGARAAVVRRAKH